jgi:hypothetical protein
MTGLPKDNDTDRSTSPAYVTSAGGPGPFRHGQLPGSIGVLQVPDNHMPIGIASEIGRTDHGLAVWGLCVHVANAPGRLISANGVRIAALSASPTSWCD